MPKHTFSLKDRLYTQDGLKCSFGDLQGVIDKRKESMGDKIAERPSRSIGKIVSKEYLDAVEEVYQDIKLSKN